MTPSHPLSWRAELLFAKGCDLDSSFRRISAFLITLDDFLDTVPVLGMDGKAELRLVCDEIGSNVVRHSTPLRDTRFCVEVDADADSIRLRLTDDGDEFNPFEREPPDIASELEKREVGGLGLYLVRQLFPLAAYRRIEGLNIVEVEYVPGEDGHRKMHRSPDTRRITRQLTRRITREILPE